MAYPGNPPKGPAPFEKAPLTPDDLERLATAFRPSWELDDAPFTGAGSLSAGDIRALQGGGTHAEVRATALTAVQGSLAPARVLAAAEEPAKVVIDPGLVAPPPSVRPPAPNVVLSSPGPWAAAAPVPVAAPAGPALAPGSKSPSMPPLKPRVSAGGPAPRASLATDPSLTSLSAFNAKKSKGLLIGGGVGAVAVVGLIVWLASGSSSTAEKPIVTPIASATAREPVQPSIPPPSPEPATTAANPPSQVAQHASAPPPPSPVVPVIAANALPIAPAQPHAAAVQPPAPHPVSSPPPPAPKAPTASRPKGATIVRDVPF
jgi:hypothetical protein